MLVFSIIRGPQCQEGTKNKTRLFDFRQGQPGLQCKYNQKTTTLRTNDTIPHFQKQVDACTTC